MWTFEFDKLVVKKIRGSYDNILTTFFKIPKKNFNDYIIFWNSNESQQQLKVLGLEVIFAKFVKKHYNDTIYLDKIGTEGYISINGHHHVG